MSRVGGGGGAIGLLMCARSGGKTNCLKGVGRRRLGSGRQGRREERKEKKEGGGRESDTGWKPEDGCEGDRRHGKQYKRQRKKEQGGGEKIKKQV